MSDIKPQWGTSTAITITAASLAQAASRESTAVDNTTNRFGRIKLYVAIKLPAGTPASEKSIYVLLYNSEDGTNYGGNATGTDAAITLSVPHNFTYIGAINAPDTGGLTWDRTFEVVGLGRKWGIILTNMTNLTFDSSGHTITFSGEYDNF